MLWILKKRVIRWDHIKTKLCFPRYATATKCTKVLKSSNISLKAKFRFEIFLSKGICSDFFFSKGRYFILNFFDPEGSFFRISKQRSFRIEFFEIMTLLDNTFLELWPFRLYKIFSDFFINYCNIILYPELKYWITNRLVPYVHIWIHFSCWN